jgi:predicted adenine nucleotide alpha hydrolase (AANH) superfamily ATPase
MNIQELETVKRENLPIKMFVLNNRVLGKISETQHFNHGDRFANTAVSGGYTVPDFKKISEGLETLEEGGARCFKCYRLRLEYSASYAKAHGYDYFTTTLSISPHKNATVLNGIGGELAEKYGVSYLFSDFKKKNGYRRSCELSEKYGLYRQDFCGCEFSRAARERQNEAQKGDM